MKSIFLILVSFVMTSVFVTDIHAQDKIEEDNKLVVIKNNNMENGFFTDYKILNKEEYSLIEENLLTGIKSENLGLQISSAYFLGEMKSNKAMIPLLRLVRNGKTNYSKIIAALSLYKINSKIGMYRLKELAQRDESELVRKLFDRLYKIHVSKNYSF